MLLEFLRTGRLSNISIGKTVLDCHLDEPEDVSVNKHSPILKFGSLELTFVNGRLYIIAIEYEPEYFESKYLIGFKDFKNISINDFELFLDNNEIPFTDYPRLTSSVQTTLLIGGEHNGSYELTASFEVENQNRLWGFFCKDLRCS
jgi:hypothetical protein